MLTHLHIENYALIEQLDIDLHPGFSVITGETGAGKSIILGAIGLLLGQRADSKALMAGAKRCVIEAAFSVEDKNLAELFNENDLDYDPQETLIRRELTATGKSRSFINDTPVQLSLLKDVGEHLIDVHSQHKNLLLGKEDFQLNTLDILAGNASLLEQYKAEFSIYQALCNKLRNAEEAIRNGRADEEYLRFQFNQLEEARLTEGEQEELETELETLTHAEDIKQALFSSQSLLSGGSDTSDILQGIKQVTATLRGISNVFSAAEELAERLNSCHIEIKDIADEIEEKCDEIEFSPERLEQVNDRLNTIYTLQKKFGKTSVSELLGLKAELDEKLQAVDNSDELLAQLKAECDNQLTKTTNIANKLSSARHKAASKVEKAMTERLVPLGMPNVRFNVEITESKLSNTGTDAVRFLFSANKGAELKPVADIASGGEIARVMLALKAMIAGAVKLPTIIFDEIDTGVSGSIAEKMARIMQEMGNANRQVISITHLPQIAAMGTSHYKVYKEDVKDQTLSHIIELTPNERITELAHMLSGETITEAALQNAKALLEG